MQIIAMRFIDPSTVDADDDIWAECCGLCGHGDNRGNAVCHRCDD